MTLENFKRKMCYDHFQAYDITLIYSIDNFDKFVRILYFNYMFFYIKKHIGNIVKNCTITMSYLQ
jgi:hypothetical protein